MNKCKWIIVAIMILQTSSFTRLFRTFKISVMSINGQDIDFNLDPILGNFNASIYELCSAASCLNGADIISKATLIRYENHIRYLVKTDFAKYLDSNKISKTWILHSSREVREEYIANKKFLEDIYKDLRNNELKLASSTYGIKVEDGLISMTDLIDTVTYLFNSEMYDHAALLSHFTIEKLFDYPEYVEEMTSLLILVGEIFRHQGNLEYATHFSAMALHIMPTTSPLRALYRLRVLMSVPPIPPAEDTSLGERAKLIEDLKWLLSDITTNGYTTSLQELMVVSATPFHFAHQGLNDRALQSAIGELYLSLCPDLQYIAPRLAWPPRTNTPTEDVLRVGFISLNFYDHSIGKILLETLYSLHASSSSPNSAVRLQVTVFFVDAQLSATLFIGHVERSGGYSPGTIGALNHEAVLASDLTRLHEEQFGGRRDQVTQAFASAFGRERYVRLFQDISFVRSVVGSARYDLDVLVFTDVGLDFTSYVLSHSRLATYQVAWWGHPITTGSPAIDFFFGLDIEVRDAASQHYSEQLVRMTYMSSVHYSKISVDDDDGSSRYALLQRLSLPDDAQYAIILARLFKIHPMFDEVLFRILRGVVADEQRASGAACYIVVVREKTLEWNHILFERWATYQRQLCCADGASQDCCSEYYLLNSVSSANVSSDEAYVLHRIRFVNYRHYSLALVHARLVLDTFPYGGCLTTHDALSNGIPIVTLPLEHVRGRYSYGMYRQMGYTDLVARSEGEFVQLATRLMRDDSFWKLQSNLSMAGFQTLHRNALVADEWAEFFLRLRS